MWFNLLVVICFIGFAITECIQYRQKQAIQKVLQALNKELSQTDSVTRATLINWVKQDVLNGFSSVHSYEVSAAYTRLNVHVTNHTQHPLIVTRLRETSLFSRDRIWEMVDFVFEVNPQMSEIE